MKTNVQVLKAFSQGRSASGLHLHTDGVNLVSYSTVVAKRQPTGEVLRTSHYYSVTTSRHLSGVGDFTVPHIDPDALEHADNYYYLCGKAAEAFGKALRARSERMRAFWNARKAEQAAIAERYYITFID